LKRLIEQEWSPDASQNWLVELVRATAPLPPLPQLSFRRVRADFVRSHSSARVWLGKAGAVGVSVGMAAVAAASVGTGWRPWEHKRSPAVAVASVADPSRSSPSHAAAVTPFAALPDDSDDLALFMPPSSGLEPGSERPTVRPSHRPEPRVLKTGDKNGEDAALVLEAIAALRNRGDGVRAGALLSEYLKSRPNGLLAEDATALAIEAAMARHDERGSGELSRRYLKQFPNGRYRAFAFQALEAAEP
jgi:hypothetical protein